MQSTKLAGVGILLLSGLLTACGGSSTSSEAMVDNNTMQVPPASGDGDSGTGNDTIPDPMTFQAQYNLPLSAQVTSNAQTITGIDIDVTVFSENGEYRINGGAWSSQPTEAEAGDMIELRATTPFVYLVRDDEKTDVYHPVTVTTLHVGDKTFNFEAHVEQREPSRDITPDTDLSQSYMGVLPGETLETSPLTIRGVEGEVFVGIARGQVSLNGSDFVNGVVKAEDGDTIAFSVATPSAYGMSDNYTFKVGDTFYDLTLSTPASAVEGSDFVIARDCKNMPADLGCLDPDNFRVILWSDSDTQMFQLPDGGENLVLPEREGNYNVTIAYERDETSKLVTYTNAPGGEVTLRDFPISLAEAPACRELAMTLTGVTGEHLSASNAYGDIDVISSDIDSNLGSSVANVTVELCYGSDVAFVSYNQKDEQYTDVSYGTYSGDNATTDITLLPAKEKKLTAYTFLSPFTRAQWSTDKDNATVYAYTPELEGSTDPLTAAQFLRLYTVDGDTAYNGTFNSTDREVANAKVNSRSTKVFNYPGSTEELVLDFTDTLIVTSRDLTHLQSEGKVNYALDGAVEPDYTVLNARFDANGVTQEHTVYALPWIAIEGNRIIALPSLEGITMPTSAIQEATLSVLETEGVIPEEVDGTLSLLSSDIPYQIKQTSVTF